MFWQIDFTDFRVELRGANNSSVARGHT